MPRESQPPLDVPKNRELLESILNSEGALGSTYNLFHQYSRRNLGFLALQGCPPLPVATYKRWAELGFHVKNGEKAYSILRPIQVKVRTEQEPDSEEKARRITKFKVVRALFNHSQVAGEGVLPPYTPPHWDEAQALDQLDITRVPYEQYDGNTQGYSYQRNVAISPVAAYPFKTLHHELGHVVIGHTAGDSLADYHAHRGLKEFEAEATAHLNLKELDASAQFDESESRAYVQRWLGSTKPDEASFGRVLTASDQILRAGYPQMADATSTTTKLLQKQPRSA